MDGNCNGTVIDGNALGTGGTSGVVPTFDFSHAISSRGFGGLHARLISPASFVKRCRFDHTSFLCAVVMQMRTMCNRARRYAFARSPEPTPPTSMRSWESMMYCCSVARVMSCSIGNGTTSFSPSWVSSWSIGSWGASSLSTKLGGVFSAAKICVFSSKVQRTILLIDKLGTCQLRKNVSPLITFKVFRWSEGASFDCAVKIIWSAELDWKLPMHRARRRTSAGWMSMLQIRGVTCFGTRVFIFLNTTVCSSSKQPVICFIQIFPSK